MNKIVIGTSVSPRNVEKQIYAINSWLKNGFRVVSCNTKEEIDMLKPLFNQVNIEFVEVIRDAKEIAEKSLPYIHDILSVIAEKTEQICGFSNSDIVMPCIDEELYQYICDETENSLLYTHRYEINDYKDIENMNWKIHIDGIDMFFVDKKIAKDFFDDQFFVQSVWDLCLLTKCKIKGVTIKELINPIAFHISHPVYWNQKVYDVPLRNFWMKYFPQSKNIYEEALAFYYEAISNQSIKKCYISEEKEKCLFIVEDFETCKREIESIKKQNYSYVTIAETDEMKNDYDIVIYMKKNVELDAVFCRSVIYLMRTYGCSRLHMGRFFISEIDDKQRYNEINRNMCLLEEINQDCNLNILVENNRNIDKEKKLLIPILDERIDLLNRQIVKRFKISGNIYMMPRGIRAIERYIVYKEKMGSDRIRGFIDNDPKKKGEIKEGLKTSSLQQVCDNEKEFSVIIASKYYSKEIEEQLSDLKNVERIYNSNLILWIDDEQNCFYFDYKGYKQRCLLL